MTNQLGFTQNFLHSPRLVADLVKLAKLGAGDFVLEVGPGRGIITDALAQAVTTAGRVCAVELDRDLVTRLKLQFKEVPQIQIIPENILSFDFSALPADYLVFSNIPFNITSDLLERLFTPQFSPQRAYLILQQDVLGVDGETFKSLLLKPLYSVEKLHSFSRRDFVPQPSVDTGLFAFVRHDQPMIWGAQYALYKDFLAFVSKDRAGEGNWKKVFSPRQLTALAEQGVVIGRGLKSQSVTGVVAAFKVFASAGKSDRVKGAMAALREEQARRETINQKGGHHRSRRSGR